MSNFSAPGSTVVPPPPPPEPTTALWEDFVDIFYAPSSVFTRRERSGFGWPLLIMAVLIGSIALANSGVMQPLMDAEFERSMRIAARDPRFTAEAMERGRSFAESLVKIGGFIFPPFAILITGFFLWLIGKLVDAKETLGAAMMVTAYAYTVRVVEVVINGVQGLLMDPSSMTSRYKLTFGAARFMDPDGASQVMIALASRVDLFTIWVTVLLAIGLHVVGKIPKQQAYIAAGITWLVGALPAVLGALRGSHTHDALVQPALRSSPATAAKAHRDTPCRWSWPQLWRQLCRQGLVRVCIILAACLPKHRHDSQRPPQAAVGRLDTDVRLSGGRVASGHATNLVRQR